MSTGWENRDVRDRKLQALGVGQNTGQSFQEILTAWLQREGGEKLGQNLPKGSWDPPQVQR